MRLLSKRKIWFLNELCSRYWQVKKKCPNCDYQWSDDTLSNMFNLKKVAAVSNRVTVARSSFDAFRWTSSGLTVTRKVLSGL